MSQDIRSYDIKNRPVLANRTKYTRCTTYYCILTYEFPLTVENRADLLAQGLPGRSDASLGVIFHLHPAPGFHHPRLALAFPQIYCLRHRLFLCVTPFYYTDHAKKCQDFDRQINQLFTGSTHRQLRPGSHRESPPTPAWPLPGLRLSLCGSNTSCRRSHAIPYTCGPGNHRSRCAGNTSCYSRTAIHPPSSRPRQNNTSLRVHCMPGIPTLHGDMYRRHSRTTSRSDARFPPHPCIRLRQQWLPLCNALYGQSQWRSHGYKNRKYFLRSSDIHWMAAFHYFL